MGQDGWVTCIGAGSGCPCPSRPDSAVAPWPWAPSAAGPSSPSSSPRPPASASSAWSPAWPGSAHCHLGQRASSRCHSDIMRQILNDVSLTLSCQVSGNLHAKWEFECLVATEKCMTYWHNNNSLLNNLPRSAACLFPNTLFLTVCVHNGVRNVPGSDHDQHYNNLWLVYYGPLTFGGFLHLHPSCVQGLCCVLISPEKSLLGSTNLQTEKN